MYNQSQTPSNHARKWAGFFFLLTSTCMLGQQCGEPRIPVGLVIPPPEVETQPRVQIETAMGLIIIELFPLQAPKTVENFLTYMNEGFYNNTIFHEVGGGVIVGGGLTADLEKKETHAPVQNESNNGLQNLRGRIALVEPDGEGSGSSQFLINLSDDPDADFDLENGSPGRTVFGRVVEGLEIADRIGDLATTSGTDSDGNDLFSLPVNPPVITRIAPEGTVIEPPPVVIPPTPEENRPPVASAGTSRNVAKGIVATLKGTGSDPDAGDQISFLWQQTAGQTITLSNALSQSPTFTVPQGPDTLTFQLTVTDLLNATATSSVTLTIVSDARVRLVTSMGTVVLDILEDGAPITSNNFLQYVEDGFYNGTIFHRVVADPTPFVVQGGGFLPNLTKKSGVRDPIVNEFSPDRSNVRETVAMAKLGGDPDSATCEFFFNLSDNSENLDAQNGGFTVFARVIEGMDVVDAMAEVETETRASFSDVPVVHIVLQTATIE